MNTETQVIKRINRLIQNENETDGFLSSLSLEEVTEETTRGELIALFSHLVTEGYNINSMFDPRYSIEAEVYPDRVQHFCSDMIELTELHNQYIKQGYVIESVDWSGKVATFYFKR